MKEQKPPSPRPRSNVLPGVIATLLGVTLVAACDRPASQGAGDERAMRERTAAQSTAAPAPREPSEPTPRIAMPPPEALTDTTITQRITTALLADPGMAGADVSVNTDRGVVSLAGTVKSHEQSGIASAHAQRQDGVLRVDNELSLAAE